MSAHTGKWEIIATTDADHNPIRALIGQRQWVHAIGQPWVPEQLAEMTGATDVDITKGRS